MIYDEIPLKTKKAMGRAYAEMRREYGASQDAVTEKLLTQRALSNFEQNGELPCWLVISALLRRVGKNADYFVPVLSKGEYDYLNWRNEMLLKLQKGSVAAEDWESGMAKSEKIHPILQRQFATFWKGFLSDDISAMQRAVAMTVPGYPGALSVKACAGTEELAYLLICMERKLQLYPETWTEEKPMLKSVLHYIETCYQKDEQVKIYYRAVCVYGFYMLGADPRQKLVYYHKALELHREMACLTGLEDILRGLIIESEKLGVKEPGEYGEYLHALEEIREEYRIGRENYITRQLSQEFYLLHEILGTYRKERGLRVSEIDRDVCSEKTYRALLLNRCNLI